MKKYFLHNGTESSGPFDLEELRAKRIKKNSPIWFEGMENWKTAGEIPELNSFFVVIPPPIPAFLIDSHKQKSEKKDRKELMILGLSKKTFFLVLGSIVVFAIVIVLNVIEENRSRELELRNHKTEIENQQYELQQKEINEQKILLEEQEKEEALKIKRQRKETATIRVLEIQILLDSNSENLELAKSKLADLSGFKLGRTAQERKEQISTLEKEIINYSTEKQDLNKELEQLKLELEKIK